MGEIDHHAEVREFLSSRSAATLPAPRESVLDALIRALQLDEAERDHLYALA
jgi:hypothetical protein